VKTYTIQEANDLLPHLAPTLVELREKYARAAEIKETIDESSMTNGGSSKRDKWNRTLARVQELLDRLEDWSIELKDIDEGIVDFPSAIHGEDAVLCWRLGESEVAWWHPRDGGFAGRQPL